MPNTCHEPAITERGHLTLLDFSAAHARKMAEADAKRRAAENQVTFALVTNPNIFAVGDPAAGHVFAVEHIQAVGPSGAFPKDPTQPLDANPGCGFWLWLLGQPEPVPVAYPDLATARSQREVLIAKLAARGQCEVKGGGNGRRPQ